MNILLLLMINILMMQGGNRHIIKTVWELKVSKTCVDKLTFTSQSNVEEYDCELGYTFHNTYKITKDTILITVKDDSHSEDYGKVEYTRTKYLIKGRGLYCIGNGKLINGKWENTILKPYIEPDYIQIK